MPVVILLLVVVAGAALGYAVVVNTAFRATLRGVAPEVSALRLLPGPVRRHARARLFPGTTAPMPAPVGVPVGADPAETTFAATAVMLRSETAVAPPPDISAPIAPSWPEMEILPAELPVVADEAWDEASPEFDPAQEYEPEPAPYREPYREAPLRRPRQRRARGRPGPRPPRKQRAAGRALSRRRRREIRRAVRSAARRDAPVWLKFFSAFRLMALLTLITLAISAVVWLTVAYAVSIVSQTIRGG